MSVVGEDLLRCGTCKEHKPTTDFAACKTFKRGYSYTCKACTKLRRELTGYHKKYHEKNKEAINAYHREHYAKNTEAHFNRLMKRRIKMMDNGPVEDILLTDLCCRDKWICGICNRPVKRSEASIDHKLPVSRGGTHTWNNVQLAHDVCNKRKWAKTPEEFAKGY